MNRFKFSGENWMGPLACDQAHANFGLCQNCPNIRSARMLIQFLNFFHLCRLFNYIFNQLAENLFICESQVCTFMWPAILNCFLGPCSRCPVCFCSLLSLNGHQSVPIIFLFVLIGPNQLDIWLIMPISLAKRQAFDIVRALRCP